MKIMFGNSPGASDGVAVTPSDTATFAKGQTRGLWVGGAGAVVVKFQNGDTVTLSGVLAGTYIPLAATGVMATGTTATLIVALY